MMINFEIFLFGLLVVSTFTGLITEAVKKTLEEHNKNYHANTLAGVISVVLSICVGVGYVFVQGIGFTIPNIIYLIALAIVSWLCSMIGYDKVIQTISQFKAYRKDE